jgi:hypothetical protein
MSTIVNALIAGQHRRLLRGVLWGTIFAALLGLGYGFVHWQVRSHIRNDQRAELARINSIRTGVVDALRMLQRDATATPCSPDFLSRGVPAGRAQ